MQELLAHGWDAAAGMKRLVVRSKLISNPIQRNVYQCCTPPEEMQIFYLLYLSNPFFATPHSVSVLYILDISEQER